MFSPSPELLARLPEDHPLRMKFGVAAQSPETIQAILVSAVQAKLDQDAKALGYDSIFTAITYVGDSNPKFAAEGLAFKNWRSAVWTYCYQALADVQAGTRTVPTAEELVAELPVLQLS